MILNFWAWKFLRLSLIDIAIISIHELIKF